MNASSTTNQNEPKNENLQKLYLNHYSDPGSNGAPIDENGIIIAIVESQRSDSDGELCPSHKATTTKNSLGPLPRYFADSSTLTVGAPITTELIELLKQIDPQLTQLHRQGARNY